MLVPYQEIQVLGFPNSPRKLGLYEKPWARISSHGPFTQLVNNKYKVEDWVGATELIIKLKPTDYECTFSKGKAGPRPLPGGVHVKIQMPIARPILLGLKFG